MKTASIATKAILATGQYKKAELYEFALAGGTTTLYFAAAEDAVTVGGHTYQTGLTIKRGPIRQKVGLEVQSLDLEITPQPDNPAGAITIGGASFLSACRAGAFDGARITMSKIFLSDWADTSPGAVPWYQGRINKVSPGRFTAQITVNDDTEILNIAMPRNVLQTGCVHTVFDAGCTLLSSAFQVSGATSGSPTTISFNTNLIQADGYWDLGTLTFTSGPNNGVSRVVKSYLSTSGQLTFIAPFLSTPGAGDTFTIIPSCKKTQAACANTNPVNGPPYNNLVHHRGYPYVPVPETLYDGGTANANTPAIGGQGWPGSGSAFAGAVAGLLTYNP